MIAITQTRGIGPGKAYLDKLQTAGKTHTQALRLLRRRLSDTAFSALRTNKRRTTKQAANTIDERKLQAA
jgi:transposase